MRDGGPSLQIPIYSEGLRHEGRFPRDLWFRTHSQHVPFLSQVADVHVQVSRLIARFGHSTIISSQFVSVRIKKFPDEELTRVMDGKTPGDFSENLEKGDKNV